jgi:hypothetical protein
MECGAHVCDLFASQRLRRKSFSRARRTPQNGRKRIRVRPARTDPGRPGRDPRNPLPCKRPPRACATFSRWETRFPGAERATPPTLHGRASEQGQAGRKRCGREQRQGRAATPRRDPQDRPRGSVRRTRGSGARLLARSAKMSTWCQAPIRRVNKDRQATSVRARTETGTRSDPAARSAGSPAGERPTNSGVRRAERAAVGKRTSRRPAQRRSTRSLPSVTRTIATCCRASGD